jgi:Fe2+ transport system protein FeoA
MFPNASAEYTVSKPNPIPDTGGCQNCSTSRVALSELRKGQTGVVCGSELSLEDSATLRAMGLCQDARIRLCRRGEPCIVAVGSGGSICGCGVGNGLENGKALARGAGSFRIGLARTLAERIFVSVDR